MQRYRECPDCKRILINDEIHFCKEHGNYFSRMSGDILQLANEPVINHPTFNSLNSDYNIYGVEKSRIIERLEEEIDALNRSLRHANKEYEEKKKENKQLSKKINRKIKQLEKTVRERDNLKIELKIFRSVNRNLMEKYKQKTH